MFNPLRPWRHPLRLLRTLGFVLTALPVGVLAFGTIVALLATSAGLLITFVLAVPFAWLLFVWSRAIGARRALPRRRADGRPHRRPGAAAARRRAGCGRLGERVGSGVRWKEIAFHLARLPVARGPFALVTAAWCGSIAMVLLPAYVDELPGESAKFYFFEVTAGGGAALARDRRRPRRSCSSPRGSPSGWAGWSSALARALLGPSAEEEHAAQVTQLETSRTRGRRQRRGRAPAHRARPARRRPAAARRAGGQPRRGAREAGPRPDRGGTDDGGGRPRGGEVGAAGDPRPRPRHPPRDPRGPRPRRRALGRRRPVADPGHARRRRRQRARRRPSRARPTSSSTRRSRTSPATPWRRRRSSASPGPATAS